MPKSEFYEIVSTGVSDFQPLDLSGAFEVVLKVSGVSGFLTDEPYSGSPRLSIGPTEPLLVIHSTDDRLFWVSSEASNSTLEAWVIRRRA